MYIPNFMQTPEEQPTTQGFNLGNLFRQVQQPTQQKPLSLANIASTAVAPNGNTFADQGNGVNWAGNRMGWQTAADGSRYWANLDTNQPSGNTDWLSGKYTPATATQNTTGDVVGGTAYTQPTAPSQPKPLPIMQPQPQIPGLQNLFPRVNWGSYQTANRGSRYFSPSSGNYSSL